MTDPRGHVQISIVPERDRLRPWLAEVWRGRELLGFFTWREIIVRYKQTVFGVAWAIIQPLTLMVVFAVFLGNLAKVPSEGLPYTLFAYSGLVVWTFHNQALTMGANSMVNNANLVAKMYFPRVLLPIASVCSFLPDLAISSTLLLVLAALYGYTPSASVLALPLVLLLGFVTVLAVSIGFSALNARYRDIKYALTFILQVWLFASPVAYPLSIVPDRWVGVYSLNPMVTVVTGFRWIFLGSDPPPADAAIISACSAVALMVLGVRYFRAVERSFADVI